MRTFRIGGIFVERNIQIPSNSNLYTCPVTSSNIALFGWAKSPGWADSCWSSRTAYSAIRTSSIFCQHLCHLADPSSRYSKNQQVLCRLEQAQPSQPFLGHPNRL